MLTLTLSKKMTDEQADALAGTMLGEDSFDILLTEDANVYAEDGSPLIIFRKRVLYAEDCTAAYANLKDAAKPSFNRGMAAGNVLEDDVVRNEIKVPTGTGNRYRRLRQDGTLSNTNYAKAVDSGIVGYFDRNPRYPYCRLTAYNLNHPEKFAASMPLIRRVDEVFKANLPERYTAQRAIVEQTSPDFHISGTVFTTITVNSNFQTAVHKDVGDYKPGFGVLTALRAGHFEGCYFCIPQYRVACDMQTGDVMLANVHEWHGNTPIKARGKFERLSLVFYYREQMKVCGTADEELARAKRRQRGESLNDD